MNTAIIDEQQANFKNICRNYVIQVLDERELSASALARELGVAVTTITRILDKKATHAPSINLLWHIAEYSKIPMPSEIAKNFKPNSVPTKAPGRPTCEAEADRNFPVPIIVVRPSNRTRPATAGVASGSFVETRPGAVSMGSMTRPPWLIGVKDAYCLQVAGSEMAPVLRPGDIVYLDPDRAAKPGDDVAVWLTEGGMRLRHFEQQDGHTYRFWSFGAKAEQPEIIPADQIFALDVVCSIVR
jgi:phage repressor protein C with HTH and peptisase S24 domain